MRLSRFFASVSFAGILVLSLAGCGGADKAPPVATPGFSASHDKVALGSPVDLTFQFDVAAPIKDDYRVLVHVVNTDGETLWIDDHEPDVPTSAWKPGQKVQYTRQVFIPVVPYTGEATVRVGLYRGDERLPLQGSDPDQRTYKVGTLQLLPQSENVFIIYKSGWNNPEFASDTKQEWQWTQKSAVVNFKNPRKDSTIYLQYDARPDLFPTPQQITLSLGGKPFKTLSASLNKPVMERMPVTAAELGDADMVELRLDLDKTFSPAQLGQGTDKRELGIRVFRLFVEPK